MLGGVGAGEGDLPGYPIRLPHRGPADRRLGGGCQPQTWSEERPRKRAVPW